MRKEQQETVTSVLAASLLGSRRTLRTTRYNATTRLSSFVRVVDTTCMRRPRLQFSLATLLLLMGVAAAIVKFGDKLLSEEALASIWLVTLLVTDWRTQSLAMRGEMKALRVALITGAVWMACIIGTHVWFVSMYDFAEGLAQAAKVAFAGVALAFFAAFLLLGIHKIRNCWRAASWRVRFRSLAFLMGVLGLVWSARWVWNFHCWEPTVISVAEWNSRIRLEAELVAKWRDPATIGRVGYSPDASTLAISTVDSITLFTATGEPIAKFDLPDEQRVFSSLIDADESALLAVVTTGDGNSELVRWDIESGMRLTPVSLDEAFDVMPPGKVYPLLINHRLLILFVEGGRASIAFDELLLSTDTPGDPAPQVQLWSLDLQPRIGNPRSFPALALTMSVEARPIGSGPRSYNSPLSVSPSGNWIARGEWLYGPDAAEPIKLSGEARGFLANGDRLAVRQTRSLPWPWWRRTARGPTEPPFSTSRLYFTRRSWSRVVVLDCAENQILARTRWYFGNTAAQPHQGRWLVSRHSKNVLLWDLQQR